jgi:hypothetical protein
VFLLGIRTSGGTLEMSIRRRLVMTVSSAGERFFFDAPSMTEWAALATMNAELHLSHFRPALPHRRQKISPTIWSGSGVAGRNV